MHIRTRFDAAARMKATVSAAIVIYILQLVGAAYPLLSALTPKSQALAMDGVLASVGAPKLAAIVLYYFVLGAVAHLVLFIATWKIYEDLRRKGPRSIQLGLRRPCAFPLVIGTACLLLLFANNLAFPNSQAAPNFDLLLAQPASPVLFGGAMIITTAAVFLWLVCAASRAIRIGLAVCAGLFITAWVPIGNPEPIGTRSDPDIIIIGVDSLRVDHLRHAGFPDAAIMPQLETLIENSVSFDQAYTTQARTFVALASVLTGKYPVNHGARENLYPRMLVDSDKSIAWALQTRGYETLFAMDESRFANIDESFGFSRTANPPMGVADFLIGSLVDTSATNLLQLLPYSDRLIPHLAGNRAAHSIYSPAIYSRKLRRTIHSVAPEKPLLLLSHFCMAHSPYANDSNIPLAWQGSSRTSTRYLAALQQADRQLADLVGALRTAGRLDNAIVVVLSDHGESLGLPTDQWTIDYVGEGHSSSRRFYGHGNPALAWNQSHILLSFQKYLNGAPQFSPLHSQRPASLVDVAPTVLSMASMDMTGDFDGIPLLDAGGFATPDVERGIFIESGLSGASLQTDNIQAGAVANEFSYLYQVTPDLRYELIPEKLESQLRAKQRAVVVNRVGVSSFPAVNGHYGNCWLKTDHSTRARCYPLHGVPADIGAHVSLICDHFRSDAAFYQTWCSAPPQGHSTSAKADSLLTVRKPHS